jgi:hypothetical protein
MRVAFAVAKYLDNAGLVDLHLDDGDGDVFIAHMPDQPDKAVMVTSTGGAEQPTLLAFDDHTVQIIVRGDPRDPMDGYDRARAIYSALQGLDLTTVDEGGDHETLVLSTTAMQSDPVPMGEDANNRAEWSLNFRMSISAPTVHRS